MNGNAFDSSGSNAPNDCNAVLMPVRWTESSRMEWWLSGGLSLYDSGCGSVSVSLCEQCLFYCCSNAIAMLAMLAMLAPLNRRGLAVTGSSALVVVILCNTRY